MSRSTGLMFFGYGLVLMLGGLVFMLRSTPNDWVRVGLAVSVGLSTLTGFVAFMTRPKRDLPQYPTIVRRELSTLAEKERSEEERHREASIPIHGYEDRER